MLEDVCRFLCPTCGTPTSELIQGRELELISLELVDDDERTDELASDGRHEHFTPDS